MEQVGPAISKTGLNAAGLSNLGTAFWNLPPAALYEHAVRRGEGQITIGGAFNALTGEHTGRSAKDKFIVRDGVTEETVDWGPNVPVDATVFDKLHAKQRAYLQGRNVYVRDMWAGADPQNRLPVRVITECAWHNLFAHNMFIRPTQAEMADFEPAFTILHTPGLQADAEADGVRSGTFIVMNFSARMVIIGGSSYAGEIKKSVFSILNFLLPERGILPMHASANIGSNGDSAIFFGLSGTGKTTLSAEGSRRLIGDDEHGWTDNGVFNFEGGCYAKVINLSRAAEPEIYATTEMFGTVLENVVVDPATLALDLNDGRYTENTRASYPLSFIPNVEESGMGDHPANIIMLTADAFGVLPPISQLTAEQAMYHFLSGYTAKVAGTEKGMGNEPQATFSTCFGAPFMSRHPTVYAKLLGERIARHGTKCWLINTGWSGGKYGIGQRFAIAHTRAMVRAALDGNLSGIGLREDPNFGLLVPVAVPDVPTNVLEPKGLWADQADYDATARDLRKRFESNFERFEPFVDTKVKAAGIRAAA